ncbi:sulfite oxidase heme-binding subunit YedZ [Methylotenera sp. G11]|uniref:sulfite oxidase heme-binding subunit YedZ n=1 Tax=Methylotenera sp. G11 TaxID=1506585 RepID=UPI0009DD6581|nr:protein-methionine-sulfoxide reductase heme-binding subunit MsrQ [Methylotenera sp. G11]
MPAWIYEKTIRLQWLAFISKVPDRKLVARLKFAIFLLCLIPLLRLFWLAFHDNLTANPVEFVERSTGYWSLFMLLATLSLSPIRLMTGRSWQLQYRRMLGLFMFFYACLHVTAYLWLDYAFDWADIARDIVKHPYVLVGASAFMLTLPLAITSNNAMIRLLRERWKQLHKLVYVIAILAVVHFLWLVKKDLREPMLYAVILALLLAIRIYYRISKRKA